MKTVQTKYGMIEGVQNCGCTVFWGIPYAAAPVGELRWRPLTDQDAALSEKMVSYWTNFIKTGDPNGDGLPRWNRFVSEQDLMVLDVEE